MPTYHYFADLASTGTVEVEDDDHVALQGTLTVTRWDDDGNADGGFSEVLETAPEQPGQFRVSIPRRYRENQIAKALVDAALGLCRDAGYMPVTLHVSGFPTSGITRVT